MKKSPFSLRALIIISCIAISCNQHFKGDESKYKGEVGFMPVDNAIAKEMIRVYHEGSYSRIEQIRLTKDETQWLVMDKRTAAVKYCAAVYPGSETCRGSKITVLVQLKKYLKNEKNPVYNYYDLCRPKKAHTSEMISNFCPPPECGPTEEPE